MLKQTRFSRVNATAAQYILICIQKIRPHESFSAPCTAVCEVAAYTPNKGMARKPRISCMQHHAWCIGEERNGLLVLLSTASALANHERKTNALAFQGERACARGCPRGKHEATAWSQLLHTLTTNEDTPATVTQQGQRYYSMLVLVRPPPPPISMGEGTCDAVFNPCTGAL